MELFKSRARVVYTNAVGDKVYPVVVDIKKGIKSTEEVTFVSSDINTGILSVAFVQGNEVYNVSGAEVVCSVMRPDASTLEIPCEVVSGNIVEVPLGVNGTSQDGVYSMDFKIFKGGNKIVGTPIMNYSVSLSIGNDMVVEEDDRLPILTMLMTQVGTLKEEATSVISQANDTIELARVATNNAVDATNNANATIERVSQDVVEVIEEVEARANDTITTMVNTVNEKVVEMDTAKIDMTNTVSNKVNEIETRFNTLTSSQQQSSEVIDARDGEASLKARLDRDIEKAKQVYVNVEGSHISTDSSSGYAKDVEIKGNTIQSASNLANIRSVGDKVEGQELYKIDVVSSNARIQKMDGTNPVKNTLLDIPRGSYVYELDENFNIISDSSGHQLSFLNNNFEQVDFFTMSKNPRQYTFAYPKEASYIKYASNNNVKYIAVIDELDLNYRFIKDKLTILSPVQLEKVGDVADRIICKDGVWGVEKNIVESVLDSNTTWGGLLTVDGYTSGWRINDYSIVICDKLKQLTIDEWKSNTVKGLYSSSSNMGIIIPSSELNSESSNGLNEWIRSNQPSVKYPTNQPQFIPLPHDQQIKLRTFANKTNISFLTEIEGMIKAQVPKSIGATVNTHTEQIGNLSKELDRVKKLEESTVSTVTTESNFTTVEETSNGYFEDVKLEGKTLVNLASTVRWGTYNGAVLNEVGVDNVTFTTVGYAKVAKVLNLIPNTDYIVTFIKSSGVQSYYRHSNDPNTGNAIVLKNGTTITTSDTGILNLSFEGEVLTNATVTELMVVKATEYRKNQAYFEGLMSVGQDVEEVSVESAIGVALDLEVGTLSVEGHPASASNRYRSVDFIKNTDGYVDIFEFDYNTYRYSVRQYDENKKIIQNTLQWETGKVKLFDNCTYFKLVLSRIDDSIFDKPNLSLYGKSQSDKKRLLYYNNETETWEKPVLRHWDSIEKHSDGKYYYHKRSGEVVLNGSESWSHRTGVTDDGLHSIFSTTNLFMYHKSSYMLCDKVNISPASGLTIAYSKGEHLGFYSGNASTDYILYYNIKKSKLSTQDVEGFKAWLQANPTTVVYQLAQEEVYECTNIDLITYANETNYVVNCGAIAPKSTLKVHNNISNVVKILQEKVSVLESNVKASQEMQDMMILESDMRILELEMALMPMNIELNIGGNPMLRSATYYNFIKRHIESETYSKEYLENVMNKYLATNRLTEAEYDELYKILYPPVYDIELPIEL